MSPLCAAGMRSGSAGASALRMVSITVGSGMLQSPIAAGHLALRILPSGKISFERPEAALVHRRLRLRQVLERHPRGGKPAANSRNWSAPAPGR